MRVLRFLPFVSLLLPSVLFAQVQSNATAATQDPQAVSVFNQALGAAGGAQAIKAVTDYTGSGNITYHGSTDVQGTVTVTGLNTTEFRLDATLPSGVRSWAVAQGVVATKNETGAISRFAPRTHLASSDAFPYQTPLFASSLAFPYRQLTAIIGNPIFSIKYIGIEQLRGISVHHIQIQRFLPQQTGIDPYHTRELFIDASSLQIVMTQDVVPKNVIHQVHYAGYTPVNGMLVPFSIGEVMGGQPTWSVQLSQITLNTGLQESAFVLQ